MGRLSAAVDVRWEELDPCNDMGLGNSLYASIEVSGVVVHLTAIEVVDGPPPRFEQTAVHETWVRELEFMQEEAGGALQTFKHKFSDGVERVMTILPSTGGA